jgi:type I restriction enzyme R subunit
VLRINRQSFEYLYDVLAYIAFASAPITREERVNARKRLIFDYYGGDKQREFLDFVLGHYIKEGVGELSESKLTPLLKLRYHGIPDAVEELGHVAHIREMFVGFQRHLYVSPPG